MQGSSVWTEGAKFKMKELVEGQGMVAMMCGVDNTSVQYLKLIDTTDEEDVLIEDILIELNLAEVAVNMSSVAKRF